MTQENQWVTQPTTKKNYHFSTGSNNPFYSAEVTLDLQGEPIRIAYLSYSNINSTSISLTLDDLERINDLVAKIRKKEI